MWLPQLPLPLLLPGPRPFREPASPLRFPWPTKVALQTDDFRVSKFPEALDMRKRHLQ